MADSHLTQQDDELVSLALWHLWPDHRECSGPHVVFASLPTARVLSVRHDLLSAKQKDSLIADFRSRKLTHNGQGQGYSKTTGRLRNHGIGRPPLSRAASRRIGLCARLSKRTTRRSACT